jgi:hypothetical protein
MKRSKEMKKLTLMMSAALVAMSAAAPSRFFGYENIRRHIRSQKRDWLKGAGGSIAQLNRWTGQPHEHRREIARNQRRAAR